MSEEQTLETETETEAAPLEEVQEKVLLTLEQVAEHKKLLEDGIKHGVEQFEKGQDEDYFYSLSETEQTYTRLLDPLVWIMREALISYEHEDCEDCRIRREEGNNGLALTVASMILGQV